MLGVLCYTDANQSVILNALRSSSDTTSQDTWITKLESLISVIREFVAFYDRLTRTMADLTRPRDEDVDAELENSDEFEAGRPSLSAANMAFTSDKDNEAASAVVSGLEAIRRRLLEGNIH
jgi:hypothetical protein